MTTNAVFAKATVEPFDYKNLLDTVLVEPHTVAGSCTLDVAGTGDYSIEPILSLGSQALGAIGLDALRDLHAGDVEVVVAHDGDLDLDRVRRRSGTARRRRRRQRDVARRDRRVRRRVERD